MAKLAPAFVGEAVILGFAVVFGEAPLGFDEILAFQTPEGGIEGAFFYEKGVVAVAADEAGDGVAVERSPDERLEDEDVESAAEEVEPGLVEICFFGAGCFGPSHFHLLPFAFMGSMPRVPLGMQGES